MKTIRIFIVVLILTGHCFTISGSAMGRVTGSRELLNQDTGIEATVRRLLESTRPQERAWGSYLVGSDGLKNLSPLLIKLLEGAKDKMSTEMSMVPRIKLREPMGKQDSHELG